MSTVFRALKELRIVDVHRACCKKWKIRYSPKNLRDNLTGNCYAVSLVLARHLNHVGITSRPAYGLWHGHNVLSPDQPFHRHGWVSIPVGKVEVIVDATRWVFTGEEPTVWYGAPGGDGSIAKDAVAYRYDEGGMLLRAGRRPPDRNESEKKYHLLLSDSMKALFTSIFGGERDWSFLTVSEAFFAGNLNPYIIPIDLVKELIEVFKKHELLELVPLDSRLYYKNVKVRKGRANACSNSR